MSNDPINPAESNLVKEYFGDGSRDYVTPNEAADIEAQQDWQTAEATPVTHGEFIQAQEALEEQAEAEAAENYTEDWYDEPSIEDLRYELEAAGYTEAEISA